MCCEPTLSVKTAADGSLLLTSKRFSLTSSPIGLEIDEYPDLRHDFLATDAVKGMLGGLEGTIESASSHESGLVIRRDVLAAANGRHVAIRVALRNKSQNRVHLRRIYPVDACGPEALQLGGDGVSRMRMMRFPDHKSAIPGYVRPSVVDKDFEDAVFSVIDAIPGQGVVYNRMNVERRTITSESLAILRHAGKPDVPACLICTLGFDKHFQTIELTTSHDRQSLERFRIVCDFDRLALDPGDEAETEWFLFTLGESDNELIETYTSTVAAQHAVPPGTKPSLTVYCTWYFYTFRFSERYLDDELAAIAKKRIPLDVFQIDDGWMDGYGTYGPHPERFPNGVEVVARKIAEAGMTPGIWLAPFVIDVDSPILHKYPDLAQRDENGKPLIYDTSTNDCYVLDPTAPGALDYLREIFAKTKGWGFRYFKLDWLRAVYEFSDVCFRDPKVNRIRAYRMAMDTIRDVLGPECYILGCGGLGDPADIGVVQGKRTSRDVRGVWGGPEGIPKSGAIIAIKQNLFRNYVNRFYDSDPDATQIRLRDTPFHPGEKKCVGVYQSEGHYTDEEAFTICAHHFLAGGITTISERFPELQPERLALLRHISPPCTPRATILDYDAPECPTRFLTSITPGCATLGNWWVLTLANWENEDAERKIRLGEIADLDPDTETFAVFEFRTQAFLGVHDRQSLVTVPLPPHGMRLLRLTPWNGRDTKILGTDLHISGGACEIAECRLTSDLIKGRLDTKWQYPVTITAGFATEDGGIAVKQSHVKCGASSFAITR